MRGGRQNPLVCVALSQRDRFVVCLFDLLSSAHLRDWVVAVLEELLLARPTIFDMSKLRTFPQPVSHPRALNTPLNT